MTLSKLFQDVCAEWQGKDTYANLDTRLIEREFGAEPPILAISAFLENLFVYALINCCSCFFQYFWQN